jgi:hypothetical protein
MHSFASTAMLCGRRRSYIRLCAAHVDCLLEYVTTVLLHSEMGFFACRNVWNVITTANVESIMEPGALCPPEQRLIASFARQCLLHDIH